MPLDLSRRETLSKVIPRVKARNSLDAQIPQSMAYLRRNAQGKSIRNGTMEITPRFHQRTGFLWVRLLATEVESSRGDSEAAVH